MSTDIEQKIITIVCDQMAASPEQRKNITRQTKLVALGAEDIDLTEIAMRLEEEFTITLDDSKKAVTIGDFVDAVKEKLDAKR
ncbi:acyl carrier protein [Dyella sp.]|uniref:acyl carrier protein n=1 Tax=Dyella sp. TaxID=1869338 RepID=UPI002D769778|nr:phosphopantetheine-binding protein [Dyella sp.]HET7329601.1 phosphopantetheine-binding protein [Dyella sp.]